MKSKEEIIDVIKIIRDSICRGNSDLWNEFNKIINDISNLMIVGPEQEPKTNFNAKDFLTKAIEVLDERAKGRDQENGERSMLHAVEIYNAMTKKNLTESDGWKFMLALKIARMSHGVFNPDDFIDIADYSALLGECEAKLNVK